ncbi:MAG TPA: translocation/assembly module TamB domain-containing protein [Acidobacteriaceae bacterium]|nr:translocation/assembly module TamB domain-containing protein [Acidobacteriaceae bacterium]
MSEETEDEAAVTPRAFWLRRTLAGTALMLALLLAVLGLASWYISTAEFQNKVRARIIAVLEDATGGRVELQDLHFSLWHLDAVGDHLVIHGLEGPNEAPYLQVDRIEIRLQIRTLFSQAVGVHMVNDGDVASHIALNLLKVDQPQMHLIVYPDGSTNQPVPKTKNTGTEPLPDTLLNLQAEEADVNDGVLLLNDRAIPFNLEARDLDANVRYQAEGDLYDINLGLSDLRTKMLKEPVVQSRLNAEMTFARHAAEIKRLEFDTGKNSRLFVTGRLQDFVHPAWVASANGTVELKQISSLSGFDGLTGGMIDLKLDGRSCAAQEIASARSSRGMGYRDIQAVPTETTATSQRTANPALWQSCDAEYLILGGVRLRKAGYVDEYVNLHDVDGDAKIRVTPAVLQLAEMEGYLPGGGSAIGGMHIDNWLGEVDAAPQAPAKMARQVQRITYAQPRSTNTVFGGTFHVLSAPIAAGASHAYLDVETRAIPLRTVMDVTAPRGYGDLGFDTAESGPVHVEWGNTGESVIVNGNLTFAPTGVHRPGARSDVPVTGYTVAQYRGSNETVAILKVHADTPASHLDASGTLGVDDGDPLTQLNADATTHDLGEFDQLFRTLGLEYHGKKGMETVPLELHGDAHFHGTASGRVEMLDVKGHVDAQNLDLILPVIGTPPPPPSRPITERLAGYFRAGGMPAPAPEPATTRRVLIDSVVADGEFVPSSLIIATATVKRGSVTLTASGRVEPHPVLVHRGDVDYDWDESTLIDAKVDMPEGQAPDVMDIAGVKTQLTGSMKLSAHVTGSFGDLNGSGSVVAANGAFYGEPYQRAEVDLNVNGQDIRATRAQLNLHGVQINGSGDYDLHSEHLRAHVQAAGLKLGQFETVDKAKIAMDGELSFQADADGTLSEPGLRATVQLANLTLGGQPLGSISAEMHSEHSTLLYSATSQLNNGYFNLDGTTELAGDYDTDAKLQLEDFDINGLLDIYAPKGITGSSSIGGTITVSGPLAAPERLNGTADIDEFDVNLSGIELQAPQPIRASLQNGLLRIDQAHIKGQDTDLKASGTAQIFSAATGATGGALHMHAEGAVNMKLAQSVDPDILSSGHVDLTMDAGGTTAKPSLTGKVQFRNVAMALEDIPNGLSQMNGTLVFNEDRLQVDNLVATTGGGQLKIGGYMTYKDGFYADLTATGDNVRVRLDGVSSTANANLRLQGSTANALLSGNILITRFGIGPDFDFAAFAGPSSVAAPPDPNAPSSHIQLEVRVTSSPQLDFQNSYAKLAGTVDLNIGGTVAVPTVLGRITVTDGSAKFAGQQYELQRGTVYFNNPVRIDPQIDVDATTRVENYDVTVGVHGTSSNLKPTYRSEPPLSEPDIFALLALGRTQEEAQIYNQQQTSAGSDPTTNALLGGALNASVSNRVQKLFGGGSVKIDPSVVGTLGTSSARITVEQQLSRNLIVTYAANVNETAEQLIQVQLNLTDNISIVAAQDETGVYSTVLKIRRRYR